MEIRYDTQELNGRIGQHLAAFLSALTGSGNDGLVGKQHLEEAQSLAGEVREKLGGKFQLVVLGDFKRGKSTLINDLLEVQVAPVDVEPETCTINCMEFAKELTVSAELIDGGRVELTPQQLRREELGRVKARLPAPMRRLHVGVPAQFLQGVVLVDTPGLGESLGEFDAEVRGYLKDADSIIYVISCLSPLAQTEQEFLRYSVAPLEFAKICFVVNFLDLLQSSDEVERVLASVRRKLGAVFPEAPVFGISAAEEGRRLLRSTSRTAIAGVNFDALFDEFRRHLNQSIVFNGELLVTDRAVSIYEELLQGMKLHTSDLLAAIRKSRGETERQIAVLTEQKDTLETSLAQIEVKLRAGIKDLVGQTKNWMREFFIRLDRDCLSILSEQEFGKTRKYLPTFLADRMQQAVTACVEAQQSRLAEMLHESQQALPRRVINSEEMVERFKFPSAVLDELPWSSMDFLALALQVVPLDPVLDIGVELVRTSEHEGRTAKLVQMLRGKLPQFQEKILQEIDGVYQSIGNGILSQLRDESVQQIDSVLDSLRAVRDLGDRSKEDDLRTVERLTALQEAILRDQEFLGQLRTKLWSGRN